ncbi:HDIG domain-containing protein [Clostridiales bacterium COT073_COT-073]|nr:HDIG domain-containing protein [Clostridiales bacterium COT073_COT-073]
MNQNREETFASDSFAAVQPEVNEEPKEIQEISEDGMEQENLPLKDDGEKSEAVNAVDPISKQSGKARKKEVIHTFLIAATFLLIALNGTVTILRNSENFVVVAFKLIFLFTISGLMTSYFYFFQKDKITESKNILLLACFLILGIVPSMYLVTILPYLMPLLLVIMLIATVFTQDIALMYGFGAVLLVAATGSLDWVNILIFLIMVLLSHQLLPYIRQRKNVIYIALISMIAFGVLVLFGHLSRFGSIQNFDWLNLVYAMLNGLISVIFLMGSLPLWESAFDVVTPNKLMELANTNNPVLQQLMREAPGTYHHSLMVANLAEKAAIDLKLDALLVRTGAMYHDIGKLKNPKYFIENQSGENPHDFLSPQESAQIIIGHVTEGVRLAKKHKLPKAVTAFIKEHHGDRLVIYFYQKEMQQNPGVEAVREQYQYPGPKPQTKEAAIVMMADVTEATIKSLPESERNLERIEQVIDQVTAYLIMENQLLESGLSFKEFDRAKSSFVDVYRGLYHERISYGSIQ